jgi:DNA-binding NarL/FixJ family response regulator
VTTLDLDAAGVSDDAAGSSAIVLLGGEGLATSTELQADLKRILGVLPENPVLLLTDSIRAADVAAAMAMGAKGYLSSSASMDLLIQVLRLLMVGGMAFPATKGDGDAVPAAAYSADRNDLPACGPSIDLFTPRELQILAALSEGKPNKIIAYEFSICETTVKVHVSHVMRKLGAKNRTHAALLAKDIADELRQAIQQQADGQRALLTES